MNFTQPVYSRPDGTYVVQYNGLPYHVTSDPTSAVLLADVQAWATANPSLVSPDPGVMTTDQKAAAGIMSLADYQNYALSQVDSKAQTKLAAGIQYNGYTFACLPDNMNYLIQLNIGVMSGMKVLPYIYDLHGETYTVTDQTDLTALNQAMGGLEQTVMQSAATLKKQIMQMTTVAQVQAAYQGF